MGFESYDKQIKRLLIEQIAHMADDLPPADFTESIMQRIQPKKPGFWQRLRKRLQKPIAVIYSKPMAAGAALLLAACLLFAYQAWRLRQFSLPGYPDLTKSGCSTVNFRLDFPSAEKVAVIGSFNNWKPDGYNLHRNRTDGTWQLMVPMKSGFHAYTFLVDDHYIIPDPLALWEQDDGFGNRNSILTINNGCPDENRI